MLKIDLLPRHFAVARTNRIVMVLLIIALAAVMGGWVFALGMVRSQIGSTQDELTAVEPKAKEVERIEGETTAKEAELAPIAQKVDFVAEADESGAQYWDRYHAITEYIAEFAQVTRVSITNPSSVNFTAIVGDTTECARFVLNLIQCPALSNVSISGLPAGVSIEGAGGAMGTFSPMGGPMGMEPGMEMGAPPPGGVPGMMEPGMMEPGMMGGPGMGGGGRVSATGEITLSIAASLTESVGEPQPPGAGGGAGAGMGMGPGMGGPGMEPGMMDPMAMEGPGGPGPGGGPPAEPAGAGGAEEDMGAE